MFEDHCAKCHAENATGRAKRPSLRSDRVQRATDGEIFWLLRNGNLPKGTPTRAALAEPMRWQIYLLHQEPGACHARRRSLRC